MCTYYYLHFHHVPPCARSVEYDVQYSFCENSTIQLATPAAPASGTAIPTGSSQVSPASVLSSPSGSNSNNQQQELELVQQPCDRLTPAPEYYGHNTNNSNNSLGGGAGADIYNYYGGGGGYGDNSHVSLDQSPCATGGCLVSQHCSSGGCRLDDLGGRWTCCKCQRGGNNYRWCVHPMKRVPDTLCYHVVCQGCWADST